MSAAVTTMARAHEARPAAREPGIALFEVRLALRSRWLWPAVAAMGVVSAGVVAFGLSAFRQLGLSAASPAVAALLSLMLLVPTACAAVIGGLALSGDRAGGFTDMLRASGVGGARIAAAKLAGVLAQTLLLVLAGFGAAAVVLAGSLPAAAVIPYVALVVVASLTTAAVGAAGVLVSSLAARGAQPAAIALGLWFALAIGLDLAIFALAPALRLGVPVLLVLLVLDPIESGRLLGLLTLGADSALLGPLGSLARATLGMGPVAAAVILVDLLWIGVAVLAAGRAVSRPD